MTRWTVIALLLAALILVPFALFNDRLSALAGVWLASDRSDWSVAWAVVALLAVDVALPVPSSLVSAAAGLALGFWLATAAIWTGMTAGCVIGYLFGSRTAAAAARFVGPAGMTRARGAWTRFGDYAIVLCRPVPVLAEASVVFAGIVGRPFRPFLAIAAGSNLGVAMGYAAIGAFAMRIDSFLLAFAGSLLVPALALAASRLWLRASDRPPREAAR